MRGSEPSVRGSCGAFYVESDRLGGVKPDHLRLLLLLIVGAGLPAASLWLDSATKAAETLRTGGVVLVLALMVWWLLGELDRRDGRCGEREAGLLQDLHAAQNENRVLWEKRVNDLVQMRNDYHAAVERLGGKKA